MRFVLLIVVTGCLALGACTYTKKDHKGRVEKISRDEYKVLRD